MTLLVDSMTRKLNRTASTTLAHLNSMDNHLESVNDVSHNTPARKRRRSDDYDMIPSQGSWESIEGSSTIAPTGVSRLGPHPPRFGSLDNRATIATTSVIGFPSSAKFADEAVAPFLARHIPEQYAPLGFRSDQPSDQTSRANSRYCYRHRPDLKCRRQADEPSMDQLQEELQTLPQSDQQGIAHVWSLFSAAPAKHRKLMLRGILAQCCFPQLSLISASVRELIRIDFVTALPPELAFKILAYLDTASLCRAAQVSRRWRSLADDDVVWHRMCEQHIHRTCNRCGWGLPLLERKRLRASRGQIERRASNWDTGGHTPGPNEFSNTPPPDPAGSGSETSDLESHCSKSNAVDNHDNKFLTFAQVDKGHAKAMIRPWKEVYKDRFKIGTNWKYGRCSIKIFKGHTNGVTCLQFEDNILATGSYDATIKIWDIETGEELRTLRGHRSGIRCLQFDESKLVSGSFDRDVKIWNWRTGECISTYPGHRAGIIGLHFDSTILASASVDTMVKIWNFEDKSTFLLRGHTDWVNAVRVDTESRTVFSASDDSTVRLWDLDTKNCIRVFHGHVGQVQQVVPLPREFEFEEHNADCEDESNSTISGDDQSQLSMSSSTSSPFGPLFENGRPPPPRYMLTSALDSTIRLWETSTGRCLRTFFGHLEGVWAVAADTLRIVSGAEDRMVKVWDPRTGKCQRTFTGHSGPVTCIGLGDSCFASGSEDCEVRMYSFTS